MDRETYAQMVDLIEVWWGPSKLWEAAELAYSGFAPLDADACFEVITSRRDDDSLAKYAPSPAVLRAEALERTRRNVPPALPEVTEKYGWAEYSMKVYGEVIPLSTAIELRHAELAAVGKALA